VKGLTGPARKIQSLGNMVKKEIRFFEDEGIRRINLQLASTVSIQ
jgi:hypothetical protein